MANVIKIYRGIDEFDGEDSLFAVLPGNKKMAVSTYMGAGDAWLIRDFERLIKGFCCEDNRLSDRCKNPTLVREVRK